VRVVSDAANRSQAEAAGLPFFSWRRAPNRQTLGAADEMDEWRRRWPPAIVRRLCETVIAGPALAYAQDVLDHIADFHPDVVVSQELLFGAMMAAERWGGRLALLTANVWCYPTRADMPPFGPGFVRRKAKWAQERDRAAAAIIARWYDAGLPDLNAARRALDLPPLTATLDQLAAADLILLGSSGAFDYGVEAPPAPFAYAGLLAEAPAWAQNEADVARLIASDRPNVLVSFSTTPQGQAGTLARCVRALRTMPVHGIVTLGPALRDLQLPPADNVTVVAAASHDALVPRCAAVVSHAGHGTVIRPLRHGVPVVCIPTGRDQPDNAARVVALGAGVRLRRSAGVGAIRKAVRKVLGDPAIRDAAQAIGAALAREPPGDQRAASALTALANAERSSVARRRSAE